MDLGPLVPGQRVNKLLFVEGDELCLRTSDEGGFELRTGQLTLAFFVDLRAVSADLADAVLADGKTGSVCLVPEAAVLAEQERRRSWSSIRARRTVGAA